jgi:hypothetical protein
LIATSRGTAFGDLDNDGGVDAVIVNNDGPVHLLRNQVGSSAHWTLLRVLNPNGVDAIGATVRIDAGGKTYARQVIPNQGYASSNDPRVHCGIGSAARIDAVAVCWPDGTREHFGPFLADRIQELRRGTGQIIPRQ